MYGRGKARNALLGAAASTFWLAGMGLPAYAAGAPGAGAFDASGVAAIPEVTVEAPAAMPNPDAGAGGSFVSTTGLKQYAMSNRQLGAVRGGMSWNGLSLSFGYEAVTTDNGTAIQGVLVSSADPTHAVILGSLGSTPTGASGSYSYSPPGSKQCSPCSSGAVVSFNNTNGSLTETTTPWSGTTVPISGNTLTVTGTTNNGQTQVQTVLSPNGIFNTISNTANGQVISQASVLSVDVPGFSQWMMSTGQVNSLIQRLNQAIGRP
jgi:hypothetical protein